MKKSSAAAEDRHLWMVRLTVTAMLAGLALLHAQTKPFWHDEIFTLMIADLASPSLIWAASLDGLDLSPPLNSLATAVVHQTVGSGHVLSRIPPLSAYLAMSLFVFEIVRRRAGLMAGVSAVLCVYLSRAANYAVEARGYALMMACFSAALFFWTEAAADRRRAVMVPALAIALGAGVWSHYYGALAFVPIVIGETVRTIRSRHPDMSVWLAIAAGGLGTLPLLPLAVVAREQSATFWRQPGPDDLWSSYAWIARLPLQRQTLIFGALLAGLIVAAWMRRTARIRRGASMPGHELAAIAAALAIPLFSLLFASITGAPFVPRYTINAAVALGIIIPLMVWLLGPGSGTADIVLCIAFVVSFAQAGSEAIVAGRDGFRHPWSGRTLLTAALERGEPVALTGPAFIQLEHYAPEKLRSGMYYLADPETALRIAGFDTVDRGYLAVKRWHPHLNVSAAETFLAEHESFTVYGADGGSAWLPAALRARGAVLLDLGTELGSTAYKVRLSSLAAAR